MYYIYILYKGSPKKKLFKKFKIKTLTFFQVILKNNFVKCRADYSSPSCSTKKGKS